MRLCALVATVAALGLQGCASPLGRQAQTDKVLQQERLEERLAEADKSLKAGKPEQALGLLDEASRIDPAAKQPWLRKAQIHFEARQYGPAISAAHEAQQRDVNDLTAKSILAVSGLRVSASALEQLRKVNEVSASTRSEAESVARIIHEALGEPILVAPAAGPGPAVNEAVSRKPVRAARGPSAPARAAPITARAPVAQTPASTGAPAPRAAPATSGRSNPFGALQ